MAIHLTEDAPVTLTGKMAAAGEAIDTGKDSASVAGSLLRGFIERVERLDEEMAELSEDRRQVYAEAKACGWDITTMRKIVRLRKLDDAKRHEADALLATYMRALGMTQFELGF